jgi:hypothetical protein
MDQRRVCLLCLREYIWAAESQQQEYKRSCRPAPTRRPACQLRQGVENSALVRDRLRTLYAAGRQREVVSTERVQVVSAAPEVPGPRFVAIDAVTDD